MSKERDELLARRQKYYERLERMRTIGDYSAGAADIRETAEVVIALIDTLLERMK